MEVGQKRALIFAGILLTFGAAARLQPPWVAPQRTEKWMESVLPKNIPGFAMISSPDNPEQSRKSDKATYDELKPYGIVCRVFRRGDQFFDTTVVASNDRGSFHSPFACLPGQDWTILESHEVKVTTATRGTIPMSVLRCTTPTEGEHLVAFCYKGPSGTYPTRDGIFSDWVWTELKLGKPPEGAFYQFFGPKDSESELLKFAVTFLDAANIGSKGVL